MRVKNKLVVKKTALNNTVLQHFESFAVLSFDSATFLKVHRFLCEKQHFTVFRAVPFEETEIICQATGGSVDSEKNGS